MYPAYSIPNTTVNFKIATPCDRERTSRLPCWCSETDATRSWLHCCPRAPPRYTVYTESAAPACVRADLRCRIDDGTSRNTNKHPLSQPHAPHVCHSVYVISRSHAERVGGLTAPSLLLETSPSPSNTRSAPRPPGAPSASTAS